MRNSTRTPTAQTQRRRRLLLSPVGGPLPLALLTVCLLLASLLPVATSAEAAPTPQQMPRVQVTPTATTTERANAADQIVFSMGEVSAVDTRAVTLTFADGQAETYRLAPETTIQTQNGDAQTVSDLDVGSMVVVIAREDDPTALTIVNGGDAGFHEAGPADMRGHQGECIACDGTPAR